MIGKGECGKAIIPPTEVPGMGAFAWFSDLDGNTIGLWKPVEPADARPRTARSRREESKP